jgi:hypothetical protein
MKQFGGCISTDIFCQIVGACGSPNQAHLSIEGLIYRTGQ